MTASIYRIGPKVSTLRGSCFYLINKYWLKIVTGPKLPNWQGGCFIEVLLSGMLSNIEEINFLIVGSNSKLYGKEALEGNTALICLHIQGHRI